MACPRHPSGATPPAPRRLRHAGLGLLTDVSSSLAFRWLFTHFITISQIPLRQIASWQRAAMAPSLRELIDFLLAEIALCGAQGASTADILVFIDVFYSKARPDETSDGAHVPLTQRSHHVDRPFQERVWSWLMRNPEVSVGKNREGNHLSLADAERLSQNEDTKESSDKQPVRVFVSEERTWVAITGHEPDETKVLPTEFALLSIIASRKSNGIVQTELVKLSGQDKRSVPRRTDMLQQKGYIEKRAIQIKSSRTSLCTLRRFSGKPTFHPTETPADRGPGTKHEAGDIIDFNLFCKKLFEVLREYKVISRNDLKKVLGLADAWRWRILSRALRKFERIGVLKRVRAMSQYSDTMKALHPCVMLLRDPSERDYELFHENSNSLLANLGQEDNTNDESDEDVEADNVTREASSTCHVGSVGMVKGEEGGRTLPIWTPDRNIHNLIFESIDSSGTVGRTNRNTIQTCFGGFFRRPLENALSRLVECWQLSQPPHLRHLAIVRDTTMRQRITLYIHYSARNFKKLVDAGAATWEAVEFTPKVKTDINIPAVDAVPQLDEYGLPVLMPSTKLLNKGDATLLECILVAKPTDYGSSGSDPVVVRLEDGSFFLRDKHQKLPHGGLKPLKSSGLGRGRPDPREDHDALIMDFDDVGHEDSADAVIGRPRKSKNHPDRFKGMSEKEMLEALGLDETWTEYNVLMMERPNPGVYITPRGRRRPAGKRQGRPRISRIAVFKSPKLASLPWFTEEAGDAKLCETAQTHEVETPVATPVIDSPEPVVRRQRRPPKQRRLSDSSRATIQDAALPTHGDRGDDGVINQTDEQVTDHVETVSRDVGPKPSDEAAAEVRDINQNFGKDEASVILSSNKRGGDDAVDLDEARTTRSKRQRHNPRQTQNLKTKEAPVALPSKKRGGSELQLDEVRMTRSKRQRRNPPQPDLGENAMPDLITHQPGEDRVSVSPETISMEQTDRAEPSLKPELSLEDATVSAVTSGDFPQGTTSTNEAALVETPPKLEVAHTINRAPSNPLEDGRDTSQTEGRRPRIKKRTDKGGSVAVLRRKIIMDIVERAGGAFPMGTELWYGFTTIWIDRYKYQEKPDLRTVRSTVKQLIDSGKLRQLTFSGKDGKGVMVTKDIVMKSGLSPDDPLVIDMQKNMLASESRFYFPPNTEINPALTKSKGLATREYKPSNSLPVEAGITVQLHQKPAFVLAQEKRKGRSIQRRLLQAMEPDGDTRTSRRSGVVRLMKISRASEQTALNGLTSIARPQTAGDEAGKRPSQRRRSYVAQGLLADSYLSGVSRMKRQWIPISTMAPYAMFMNPRQIFHASTGTFSTDAGLGAVRKPSLGRGRTAPELPESLNDLFSQTRRHKVDFSSYPDPRSSQFFSDSDAILRWELQNEDLLHAKSPNLRFINQMAHGAFDTAPVEGEIRFHIDEPIQPSAPAPQPAVTRAFARRAARPPEPVVELTPEVQETTVRRRKRISAAVGPQNRRLTKLTESLTADEPISTAATRQVARRNRIARQLPDSFVQRVMTTIIAVRALAGGVEGKMIDWGMVAKAFPGYDAKFIQERGKNILSRNRLQMAKMQSDFQEWFIDAYQKDEVPQIDYDDLEAYDWEGVVDWASTQLDLPTSEKLPDLPATREQFDRVFELREEALPTLDELYQHSSVALSRRRAIAASVPFAIPLKERQLEATQRKTELSRLETAKTWVRANVTAPEESYKPAEARQALERFGEPLVSNAVQSLVTERAISMGNRGRITPGRNYDITDHFLSTLGRKRAIDSTELRRAARFKTQFLDPALQTQGTYDIKYNAEDGDILAILNLAAEGKVSLRPRDPPRDKFGLTEGGYLTRQMDKQKLWFRVEVQPVPGKYVFGNPVHVKASTIPPPRPPRDTLDPNTSPSPPPKIPIWMDIHGNFVRLLWDLVVAAVLGCVAIRPGINAEEIAKMIKPTMGAWEVQLLLDWLAAVGVVKHVNEPDERDSAKEGSCWVLREGWWMILG